MPGRTSTRDTISRNVVIVSQFYAPEPCAAAHRVQALARALAARGNRVHVVAPHPSFPSGVIEERYRGKFLVREREEIARSDNGGNSGEIRVTRVHHIASAKRGGRVLAWGSFAFLASLIVVFLPQKIDLIIVSSPPISVGFPGLVGRILRGAKLIVDVRDVFPDLIIQAGIWKETSFIARLVTRFACTLYRHATFVTVVTQTARERVLRRTPFANVELFPNAADTIQPTDVIPSVAPKARSRGTDGMPSFVATFAGNMGLANGMDVILDAAKLVADKNVRIVLIGGGADYDRVAKRVRDESIDNVELLGVLPRAAAVGALIESDASLVNLRDGVQESIPTKIFDAFAAGCPVILSAEGEARKLIEESQAGISVQPGDARALADAILMLKNHPQLAKTYATNGKALVECHYNREKIMADYAKRIIEMY